MSSRPIRTLRGAAAASVSVFVALFAHVVIGGGAMPGVLGILVPLVLALPVCVLLAGRRLSLLWLAASVAASQVLFNALFVLGAPTSAVAPTPHHGMTPPLLAAGEPTAAAPGIAMWGAHVVAFALTTTLLYLAERCLRVGVHAATVLRAWLDRLRDADEVVVASFRVPRLVARRSSDVIPSRLLRASIVRRGPPAFSAL